MEGQARYENGADAGVNAGAGASRDAQQSQPNDSTGTHSLSQSPAAHRLYNGPSYASQTLSRKNSMNLTLTPPKTSTSTSTPLAVASPRSLHRTSSSIDQSHNRTPSIPSSTPKMHIPRKNSTSSLRSMASSPGMSSPRRAPTSVDHVPSPRRTISSIDLARPLPAISAYSTALPDSIEETPFMTATSVASEYFARELSSHEDAIADTVVIIHDACYGHRFSRPKTTKSSLSMIVERPERILASALGISAAYIRLGSRHTTGQYAPHPDKAPDPRPPFKIRKSSRLMPITSDPVVAVHGEKWMRELQVMCESAGTRLALGVKELARTEEPSPSAGQAEKPTFHEGDLYLCSESLNALQGAIGGVCDAVDAIFAPSPDAPHRAFVAVRPPGHHCSSDWPSGFCWINNVHIGIEYAAQTYGLTHAAIFDFDLHHGDGSQDIAWERNTKSAAMPKSALFSKKPSIGYYSMHDINSYPCEWGDKEKVQNASLCIDNAHGQSIWNVHLQPWTTMDEFWNLYETKYLVLLEKARSFLKAHTARIKATPKQVPAKAAIFISAGFDASEWEGAGMQRHAVNVPTEFYARFTKDVVKLAQEEGTAVDGRVISVLEGGYSDRALTSGVFSHLSGLTQVHPADNSEGGIVSAIQKMNIAAVGLEEPSVIAQHQKQVPEYDIDWWHVANLTALENYITPPPPPPAAPKRAQRTAMPTYATPTESFTYKVVDPINFKRSMSGTLRTVPFAIPKAQAVPEVDWIVATHELSKLLIPADRQTRSCKPEELTAPRMKKERLSGPPAIPVENGRVTRGRKARTPPTETTTSPPDMDSMIESMRRQTISDLPQRDEDLPVLPNKPLPKPAPRRSTRRFDQIFGVEIDATSAAKVPVVAAIPPSQPPPAATAAIAAPAKARRPARAPTAFKPAPAPTTNRQDSNSASSSARGSVDSDRNIAGGPKRITLRLGSREESERKTKEKMEADKAKSKSGRSVSSKTTVAKASEMAPPPVPHLSVKVPDNENLPMTEPKDTASVQTTHTQPSQPKTGEPGDHTVKEQTARGDIFDDDTHSRSPPMFTPTFMSQMHSPAFSRTTSDAASGPSSPMLRRISGSIVAGTDILATQPTSHPQQYSEANTANAWLDAHQGNDFNKMAGEVAYEFRPQPLPRQPSERLGGINEMIRTSMLVHPRMIVADHVDATQQQGPKQGQLYDQESTQGRKLPVFSATGAIPFAPASVLSNGLVGLSGAHMQTNNGDQGKGLGITSPTRDHGFGFNDDFDDVTTPKKTSHLSSAGPTSEASGIENEARNISRRENDMAVHSSTVSPDKTPRPQQKSASNGGDADMMDMWEVPETPSPKR